MVDGASIMTDKGSDIEGDLQNIGLQLSIPSLKKRS